MEKKYLALNSALLFWLLGLVAWCFYQTHLAWLSGVLSVTAFIIHFQPTQVNGMFKNKNSTALPPSPLSEPKQTRHATIVANGVNVDGNITADSNVEIYGLLNGNIDAQDNQITIGREGQVEGNITCRELVIGGTVTGQCTSDSIEIDENGKVSGTLIYRTLAVKKGGVFSGQAGILADDIGNNGEPASGKAIAQPDPDTEERQEALMAPFVCPSA